MTHFKSFIQSAILIAAMAFGAAPAFAGPTYNVTIDTSRLSETSGLLDFFLTSNADSPDLTSVTLTNFTGNFGAEYAREGDVADIAGGYVIGSGAGWSWLTRTVNLGGSFGFTVGFADGFGGIDAVGLAVSLFDANQQQYLGADGPLVFFTLVPETDGAPSFVTVEADNARTTVAEAVAEVPEPSDLLLMLTGLALAGFATRRARQRSNGHSNGHSK